MSADEGDECLKMRVIKAEDVGNVDVHLFSCDIHSTGQAKQKRDKTKATKAPESFVPRIQPLEGQPGVFKSQCRGRQLKGRQLSLPEGYCGIVSRSPATEPEPDTRTVRVSGTFDKITAWNWHVPLCEDKCRQINDWILLSKAVHGTDSDWR
ncbi:hypothetical protein HPB48_015198 [Haemaphysalis longicornis]|uniref:Uncharacterized protein n=1 Tax=Haemaphysalis longicornis TaxID=44386 RepID=A0A9J6FJ44_HAELO|nr:hypothetical protein HPB48_015198 [Haemaphysalis longicornis]